MDIARPAPPTWRIWAAYGRNGPDEPWRLRTMSVMSPERARALAEREQLRLGVASVGTDLLVCEYDSPSAVPWLIT